jgi:hypothetical protein
MDSFVWFLDHRGYETCGLTEIRAFFHYLNHVICLLVTYHSALWPRPGSPTV